MQQTQRILADTIKICLTGVSHGCTLARILRTGNGNYRCMAGNALEANCSRMSNLQQLKLERQYKVGGSPLRIRRWQGIYIRGHSECKYQLQHLRLHNHVQCNQDGPLESKRSTTHRNSTTVGRRRWIRLNHPQAADSYGRLNSHQVNRSVMTTKGPQVQPCTSSQCIGL